LKKWIEHRSTQLFHLPPEAGAIAFVRYAHTINSTHLIERLRDEKGVLVVPGDHFEMDGYLRVGFGTDPTHLTGSLNQIGELLDTLPGAFADAR
jgi:aspartate/methionine/tyrosine aminotransferase